MFFLKDINLFIFFYLLKTPLILFETNFSNKSIDFDFSADCSELNVSL